MANKESAGEKSAKISGRFLVIGAVIAVVGTIVVALLKSRSAPIPATNSQTATTHGNNSPVTQHIVHGAATPELQKIYELMNSLRTDKKKEELERIFPNGYILFTVTEKGTGRQQIIPQQHSPLDDFVFDWKSEYSVTFEPGLIWLRLPNMLYKEAATYSLDNVRIGVPRIEGATVRPMVLGTNALFLHVVSTNSGSAVLAAGIRANAKRR